MALEVGVNSYISTEDADAYFAARLYADAWDQAEPTDKEKALQQATKGIDRQPLSGRPFELDQDLQFPRCFFAPSAPPMQKQFQFPPGWWCQQGIVQSVKDATCEEALSLLERGNSERRKLQQEGVESFSLGSLSESYRAGTAKGLLSVEAKELLRPYLAGSVLIR